MRNAQVVILNASDAASQNGNQIDVGQCVSASFTALFGDTTATGTVKIQCCNDSPAPQDRAHYLVPSNHWSDIPNATASVTAGVAPAIVIPNMCFSWIRVVYTRSAGGSSTIVVAMNELST